MVGDDNYGVTQLHPLALIIVLVLGMALLVVPRRFATYPVLILACIVPSAQRLVIMGADFDLMRIMVLFGWLRLCIRKEFHGFQWNRLDTLLVSWMACGTAIFTMQQGEVGALVNRLGWMFDGFGMYFLFRCVIRDWEDLERLAFGFVMVSIPIAAAFAVEFLTGRNFFGFFGGVPEITMIREGRLRCQGAFKHPILAGCFWASVMPLILMMCRSSRKQLASVSLGATLLIVVTCSSSTPILAVGFVIIGMLLFRYRYHLHIVRWGFVLSLVALHLLMEKPVWHILARVNAVGGSTGWHRFRIMDATINHFGDWALLGESNPMSWGIWEMRDITNQYIIEALRGGFLTLSLFILLLANAFGIVGQSLRAMEGEQMRVFQIWCVGVSLFVHTAIFYGVSYFGQIIILLYITLAMIGSMPVIISSSKPAKMNALGTEGYLPLLKGKSR